MQLFRHKLDAELIKQSKRVCFPDSSMPFTDCVCCGDGCCRHRFAPQIFELRSELAFKFSSWVVNQPSRYAKRSDPVFEKVVHTIFGCLLGIMATTPSACEVKNVYEAQLIAFIICQNKQVNGCRVTKLSVCAKSCRQMDSRMLHIASQLKCCANCSCALQVRGSKDVPNSCACGEDL